MMTTGYDCQDILNIALMRPIFSPTNFIQIKGRGTRKFTFKYNDPDNNTHKSDKVNFKLFDFFANCEYFENEFDYDEVLELPAEAGISKKTGVSTVYSVTEIFDPDKINLIREKTVGIDGMKVDRKLFDKARDEIKNDVDVKQAVENEQWERAITLTRDKYENKPELFLTLEKIRKSENLDRRLTWREVLERIYGLIDGFKTKDEKLEEECEKFISIHKPENENIINIKNYLKLYVADEHFRQIINEKNYGELDFYPAFSKQELKSLNEWRDIIPQYAKDYISFNTYAG